MGSLGYSELVLWVAVQKRLETTSLRRWASLARQAKKTGIRGRLHLYPQEFENFPTLLYPCARQEGRSTNLQGLNAT